MCGCQAHHKKAEVCTCWCPAAQHSDPVNAQHEQRVRWDDHQKPEGERILPMPAYIPEERP